MKSRIETHFSLKQQILFLKGVACNSEEDEFLLDHSRSGIFLALKALQLPHHAGVGMMAYNCHTVMNAISQADCIPVFIDVNDDLTIDIDDLTRKSKCISVLIISHLFGIVNDVQKIQQRFPGLIVIEDCAHAYGIKELFGDFATFSFGQGKLPSIGDGGSLLVRNELYKSRVFSLYDGLQEYKKVQSIKLFLKMMIRSWLNSPLVYGWLTLPLKLRRSIASGRETIVPKKMCKGIKAIYHEERECVSSSIEKRNNNAEHLKTLPILNEEGTYLIMGINAFMLVVRCQCPERIRSGLKSIGLDSATHFSNSLVWAKEFGYSMGDCPNTEKLIGELLMIPTY